MITWTLCPIVHVIFGMLFPGVGLPNDHGSLWERMRDIIAICVCHSVTDLPSGGLNHLPQAMCSAFENGLRPGN